VGQESAIEDALERGARRLDRWTQDGTLIAPQQLAKAWGQDLQILQAVVQHGDVFEVWVGNAPYFAAVFTAMGVDATARVCRALGGLPATAKLIFLKSEHDGLNGQTVLQALASGTPIGRIEQLAAEAING